MKIYGAIMWGAKNENKTSKIPLKIYKNSYGKTSLITEKYL
jgi:hypothetical protein